MIKTLFLERIVDGRIRFLHARIIQIGPLFSIDRRGSFGKFLSSRESSEESISKKNVCFQTHLPVVSFVYIATLTIRKSSENTSASKYPVAPVWSLDCCYRAVPTILLVARTHGSHRPLQLALRCSGYGGIPRFVALRDTSDEERETKDFPCFKISHFPRNVRRETHMFPI